MGAKRFKIDFTSIPISGAQITFRVSYDGDVVMLYNYTFNNASTIVIGEDLTECAIFLRAHINSIITATGLTNAYTELSGDIVYIYFGNNTIDVTGYFSNTLETGNVQEGTYEYANVEIEDYTFVEPENPEEAIVLDPQTILSRSPYWFSYSPGITYDSMALQLYIYHGHVTDDRPASATYSMSKSVVYAGQPAISFDLQGIINDYVKNRYYPIGTVGAMTTSFRDSIWCFVEAEIYLGEDKLTTVTQQLFAVDGFGYHIEGYNPEIDSNVLSSVTDHIFYGSTYPLYFLTDDLTSITVNGTSVPFTFSQDYNNQKVAYVNVANYAGVSTSFTAVFVYGSGEDAQTITHTFTKKTECKHDVYNCIFKNKDGFWQTIPFNKLHRTEMNRTASEYQGTITSNGQYDITEHVSRTFQLNAVDKITVNTDHIPESYNALFDELYLSEFVYLETGGQTLPVVLKKNTFNRKTRLYDKLVQYSMEFEYGFDKINMVK